MGVKIIAAVLLASSVAALPAVADGGGGRGRGRGADDAAERAGAGISQAAQVSDPADEGAKALFEAKCSACHSLSRPLGKTKDEAGWTATVKRMQQVNGCPIMDEEAARIIAYLTRIRGQKKAE